MTIAAAVIVSDASYRKSPGSSTVSKNIYTLANHKQIAIVAISNRNVSCATTDIRRNKNEETWTSPIAFATSIYGWGINYNGKHTVFQKTPPPLIFWITRRQNEPILIIFGVQNPEEISQTGPIGSGV